MLSVLIDPNAFDAADAQREADAFVAWAKASPQAGDAPVQVPGEPEEASRAARGAGGIPVDRATWRQIRESAAAIGFDEAGRRVDAALQGIRMSWQSEQAHGEEIAYQLAPLGNVTVARFFSGAAMRLDGVMFGFMSRGSLFLRVDDVNRPAFVAAGMGPFSYERPTRTVSLDGYYETPADVLEDAGALFDWCRSAYRAAPAGRRSARRGAESEAGAGSDARVEAGRQAGIGSVVEIGARAGRRR